MTGAADVRLPPRADYLVLASRAALDLDGGFAVAIAWRLRQLRDAGAVGVQLLTLDAATPAEHARRRAQYVARGLAASVGDFRNLFDDAVADPSWLVRAARPGAADPALAYRTVRDAAGRAVVSLPVVHDPAWHLSTAPIVVHGRGVGDGAVHTGDVALHDEDASDGVRTSSGGDGPSPAGDVCAGRLVLDGFGALYRAWLGHVARRLRAAAGDPGRVLVVVCESRQVGELLADWRDPHVRIVHTVHNSHLPAPYDDPDAALAPPWVRWLARIDRFDAVLWPTRAQRDDVAARFGDPGTFHVVPNPIDLGPEPAGPTGRRPGAVVMLTRLADQKRVDRAITAFARVHAVVPGTTLDIYGDGPLRESLQRLIDDEGLTGIARLRGNIEPARRDAVFETATLLLVSSAFEGQGLSIAEALARGLPVAAFDVRYGPAEVIRDGGVLVPPGDVDALADAVIALLRDRPRRVALSAPARTAARALSVSAVRPALVTALADAVGRPSRRA